MKSKAGTTKPEYTKSIVRGLAKFQPFKFWLSIFEASILKIMLPINTKIRENMMKQCVN